jgi:hypothetical protein
MASRTIHVALTVLTITAAGAVGAQTTYDYSGTPMSGTEVGSFIGPGGEGATYSYCCTTLDGSMTLTSPLAPNLNNAVVDPIAVTFSFASIGGAMGTPPGANPGAPYSVGKTGGAVLTFPGEFGGSSALPALLATFTVSTNSAGQITSANVQGGTPMSGSPVNWEFTSTSAGDTLTANTGTHGPNYTLSSNTQGSWNTVPTQSVPEIDAGGAPAALTMLGAVVVLLRGRRRVDGK